MAPPQGHRSTGGSKRQPGVPTRQQLSSRNDRNAKHKKTVGSYILGKSIGEGTFGKVKAGQHILTGEKVRDQSLFFLFFVIFFTQPPTVFTLLTQKIKMFSSGRNQDPGQEQNH